MPRRNSVDYKRIKKVDVKIDFNQILGQSDPEEITLDPRLDIKNLFSTLIHELLHCAFYHIDGLVSKDGEDILNQEEIVEDLERFMVANLLKIFNVKMKPSAKKNLQKAVKEIKENLAKVKEM